MKAHLAEKWGQTRVGPISLQSDPLPIRARAPILLPLRSIEGPSVRVRPFSCLFDRLRGRTYLPIPFLRRAPRPFLISHAPPSPSPPLKSPWQRQRVDGGGLGWRTTVRAEAAARFISPTEVWFGGGSSAAAWDGGGWRPWVAGRRRLGRSGAEERGHTMRSRLRTAPVVGCRRRSRRRARRADDGGLGAAREAVPVQSSAHGRSPLRALWRRPGD